MKNILVRYKSHIIYFLVFSLVFFIVRLMFLYFLPFLIGITVSFIMYPVYIFMKKRLSFKPAFSATVITLFIFSVILSLLFFVCYLLIRECVNLYYNNIDFFNRYISEVDYAQLLKDLNFGSDVFTKLSDTAFSVVKIVPMFITLILISFVCTVFFINNLPKIKLLIISKLSEEYAQILNDTINKGLTVSKKFIKSYMLLYLLTFIESVFIFSLIKLEYVLVFAFLATVSDLLPVFGPGTVYLPIAVIKILSGDYLSGITLIVFWAIVIIIRQIIEPKMVSDTIKIHPLVIFSALYFSIVSSNIWVLFYITIYTVVYKILIESGALKPIFSTVSDNDNKES